jgi:hypothetical protein
MVLPVVLYRYEIWYPTWRGKTQTIEMFENKGKARQHKIVPLFSYAPHEEGF